MGFISPCAFSYFFSTSDHHFYFKPIRCHYVQSVLTKQCSYQENKNGDVLMIKID